MVQLRLDEEIAPGRVVGAAIAFSVERKQPTGFVLIDEDIPSIKAMTDHLHVACSKRAPFHESAKARAQKNHQTVGNAVGVFDQFQQRPQLGFARSVLAEAIDQPNSGGGIHIGLGAVFKHMIANGFRKALRPGAIAIGHARFERDQRLGFIARNHAIGEHFAAKTQRVGGVGAPFRGQFVRERFEGVRRHLATPNSWSTIASVL